MSSSSPFDILQQGTIQVIPEDEFVAKLNTNKPLTIKLGMDPTAPDLHLGHAVVFSKLRQFQDLGHRIVFLIGDFTARIGDPTGRSKTRPPLSEDQIFHNTKTYFEQVGKILDTNKLEVRYNSEWLDRLTSKEWVTLCGKVTLARIIEREDFAQRLSQHQSIGFHELLYPLMQGYDSVALNTDVELGGTDQTFNLLMGRYLQEQFGQSPQIIITLPLLPGIDGVAKMSKSLGNAIGLTESAEQAFGKLMSISDELMWQYYEILLIGKNKTEKLKADVSNGTAHPMELKKQLAHDIIAKFWSPVEAKNALSLFERLFQKKDYSLATKVSLPEGTPKELKLVDLLKLLGAIPSLSEGRRLIEAGAVSIDYQKVSDPKYIISWKPGTIIKVGKHRFYNIS